MTTTTRTTCPTCEGTGIDPARAATPLAVPGFAAYVAAMYPCPTCSTDRTKKVQESVHRMELAVKPTGKRSRPLFWQVQVVENGLVLRRKSFRDHGAAQDAAARAQGLGFGTRIIAMDHHQEDM
jgi:hypothetical protein